MRSAWLVSAAALAAGCAAPVDIVTRMQPDGTVERSVSQPVQRAERDFQLDVPPADQAGWAEFSNDGGRCKMSGTFPPGVEVSGHWTASLKGGDLTSRNQAIRSVTDYGLFTLFRFEEVISNAVTPEEFHRARAELRDMVVPIFNEWLDQTYGAGYDVERLKAFVRDSVVPTVERMAQQAYEYGREQPANAPNPRELVRRTVKPLDDLGLKTDPGNPLSSTGKALARLWASAKVKELVRKKPDGAELTPSEALAIIEETETPAWREQAKKTADAIIAAKHGGREVFDQKTRRVVGRMAGIYGGPLTIFPRLRFTFDLSLPGEPVGANGERTWGGGIRWRFYEHALYPDGYRMWAESAVIQPAVQSRLFGGRVPLPDGAAVESVRAVLRAADVKQARPVEAALRESAAAGDLAPLRKLAESNPTAAAVLGKLEN